MSTPQWLTWATQLQAIAQNGLYFSKNEFDIERFEEIKHIAADIIAQHSHHDINKTKDLFTLEYGYATPKIGVRGVAFRDEKILLVKETQDGLWSLPGGWADAGESLRRGVEKEIEQESGFTAKATKLLAVYDKLKHPYPSHWPHTYIAFILCEITGGTARPSIETTDVGFFGVDELPGLSLPRNITEHVVRMFELCKNPAGPTEFD